MLNSANTILLHTGLSLPAFVLAPARSGEPVLRHRTLCSDLADDHVSGGLLGQVLQLRDLSHIVEARVFASSSTATLRGSFARLDWGATNQAAGLIAVASIAFPDC